MKRTLVLYPDDRLRTSCQAVGPVSQQDRQLIEDMIETMVAERGVGLAACQVGVGKRIFVAAPEGQRGEVLVILNPVLKGEEGEVLSPEGCLSLPGVSCEVRRARAVDLEGTDPQGRPVRRRLEGFLARIVQHEVDHLAGRLILDRVGFQERAAILAALGKQS